MEKEMHFVEYLDLELKKKIESIDKRRERFDIRPPSYNIRVPITPKFDQPLEHIRLLAQKGQRISIILCNMSPNGIISFYFSDYDIVMFLSRIDNLNPNVGHFIFQSLKAYIEGKSKSVNYIIGEQSFTFRGLPYLDSNYECDWGGCSIPLNAMIAVLNLILEKEKLDQRDEEHVSTAIKLLFASIFYSNNTNESIKDSISDTYAHILSDERINDTGNKKFYAKKSDIRDSLWYNSI